MAFLSALCMLAVAPAAADEFLQPRRATQSYPHINPSGCSGGCDCDWLSTDNCEDKEWCCAGACRDYYHDPAGCSGESYPKINPSGCSGGCDCDWLSADDCQDKDWCCAGACRDYYHNPAGCSGAALLLANQSQLEQSLTAESYPHINPSGCSGGCDCDWLSTDNCQDKEWCCAGACRDYYHNPAGCSGAALLANQSQLEQSLTAESYPHINPSGCSGGCDCDWLSTDNCEDKDWCCAGACRDYYHDPAGCSGESYPHINPSGCSGGCDCDWLSTDNCQDKDWCCAGACRDYYHNPAGC